MLRLLSALSLVISVMSEQSLADVASFSAPKQEIRYFEDPGPEDDWFGRIVIYNRDGSSGNPRTFQTSAGKMVVTHTVTPNWPCRDAMKQPSETCADDIQPTILPPGVEAHPPQVRLHEKNEAVIYLYRVYLAF